jgi:Ni/Co efflux regulator RcnB
MLKTTIAAAFVAAAFALPAHAAPVLAPAQSVGEAKLQLVQSRDHHRRYNRRDYRRDRAHDRRRYYGRNHYRGDRYRGWNRYSSRPWNWRARGCASVGPVWFCP